MELLQQVGQWTLVFVLAALAYFALNRYVLQTVQVQGQSMLPTLHDSDRYFLNRVAYFLHPPQAGDVVVLRDPSDGGYAVKRVIAGSGDAIYFKSGRVFVNGHRIAEPYLAPGTATFTPTKRSEIMIVCGRNQYFVLGDNRNNSYDSRMYGPVPGQNILGAIIH
ncbi:MAG: signal peptidase I [Verrucomicrobiota bacterium]